MANAGYFVANFFTTQISPSMKRATLSLLALALVATVAQAQLQKGATVLGIATGQSTAPGFFYFNLAGSSVFGFNTFSGDGSTITVFSVSPRVSHAVTDRVLVGSSLDFTYLDSDGDHVTSFGLNPFVRAHFPIGGSPRAQFIAQAGLGVGAAGGDDNFLSDLTSRQVNFGVGMAVFPGSAVSIDALIGYMKTWLKEKYDGDSDTYSVGQFGVNVGASIYFNRAASK